MCLIYVSECVMETTEKAARAQGFFRLEAPWTSILTRKIAFSRFLVMKRYYQDYQAAISATSLATI